MRKVFVVGFLFFAVSPAFAQHLGTRQQWQPQTEHDARLQQAVRTEILGRAAVSALKLLSKKTDVSLGVAPEDLDTVGERKLTIIAQGCSLKALLVQIPEALQECHVDVDPSGLHPVYLLHRNGGVEAAMVQSDQDARRRRVEEGCPARRARLAAARQALAMSPQELDELAKTDPLLALAAKDAEARKWMTAMISLPQQALDELTAKGQADVDSALLPESTRGLMESFVQTGIQKSRASSSAKLFSPLLDAVRTGKAILSCGANTDPGLADVDIGLNVGMQGYGPSMGMIHPIPPRLPDSTTARYVWRPLLARTGAPGGGDVDVFLADLAKQHDREAAAARDKRREAEWREPPRPELHRMVTLPFRQTVDPLELQQFFAKESGLSLVSDYFTAWGQLRIPEEAASPLPLWKLLYVLAENWSWSYGWDQAGDCLVLHDQRWYATVPTECPESLIIFIREKLAKQKGLTLDDAVAFAVGLDRRRPARPELEPVRFRLPDDLRREGLLSLEFTRGPALIYASLSPEQREQARTPAGLSYRDMAPAQKRLVERSAVLRVGPRILQSLPGEEIGAAVYRVTQSVRDITKLRPGEGSSYPPPGPGPRDVFELSVQFPSRTERLAFWLAPVIAPAPSGSLGSGRRSGKAE